MKFSNFILFLLCILNLNTTKVKAITITAFTFSFTEKQAFFNSLSKAFNDYSNKNGLDIKFEIELLTPDNSTTIVGDQLYTVDALLKKKSQKHDIYIYYSPYTYRYGEHLEHIPLYTTSALPGNKAGVSGTLSIPNNLGINKYVGEERIKAAAEVVKYLTSKEAQKKCIIKSHQMSAITSLYYDEEVCEIIDCRVMLDAMPVKPILFEKDGYGNDYYLYKLREYLLDFMYGNVTAKETVKKINNILEVQNFSVKTDKTIVGLLVFIMVILTLFIQLTLLLLLFIKSFNKYYLFLTKDLWLIFVFGSMMTMTSIFTLYGDVTQLKCHVRLTYLLGGYYICILPIFCKLIINIPDSNRYSKWVQSHLYLFIFLMISVEVIINLSRLLIPLYEIEKIIVPNGDNFNKCNSLSGIGALIYYFEIIWILIILLCSLFLIFIEWNLKTTLYQIRCITASIFATILSFIVYLIFSKLYIKNHIAYNLFYSCNLYILALSNYAFIYGLEIVQPLIRNEKEEEYAKILKNLKLDVVKSSTIPEESDYSNSTFGKTANNNQSTSYKVSFSRQNTSQYTETNRKSSIKKRSSNYILQLHYKEEYDPSEN